MKRPDPVEIVAIAVPVLIELVTMCLFMGAIAVWAALLAGA